MLRKILLACVAAALVAVVALPTEALARGHGGGHGGFHGSGFHGAFHGGFHGRFRGGWGGPRFGYYPYYGDYDCYRTVRVFTPYGPRVRRVWVCG
jgi:hypothetical protein